MYLAEGLRIVIEAIQTGQPIESLVIAPELMKSNPGDALVREYLAAHPEQVIEVSADVFRSFSVKDGPQGVAALLQPVWKPLERSNPEKRISMSRWMRWQTPATWGRSCARPTLPVLEGYF